MRLRLIEHHLRRAAKLRSGWGHIGGRDAPGGTTTRETRIEWHENEAARLLADGLKKRAARHPRTKYSLRSYHRLHGTGTGSGGHNIPPERRDRSGNSARKKPKTED